MLVLTRRAGESIMIDDVKIRGSQVHLGIEAPRQAAVHRKEVWLRIQNGGNDDLTGDERPSPKPLASGKARVSVGE